MTKKTNQLKAGQYYAAKYNGDNGDLIIGKIESVRTNGVVLLTNLLTHTRSTKNASVLTKRNVRVSKSQTDELILLFKETGDRAKVRVRAVEMTSANQFVTDVNTPSIKSKKKELEKLVSDFVKSLCRLLEAE
jgi:hypothetical protein